MRSAIRITVGTGIGFLGFIAIQDTIEKRVSNLEARVSVLEKKHKLQRVDPVEDPPAVSEFDLSSLGDFVVPVVLKNKSLQLSDFRRRIYEDRIQFSMELDFFELGKDARAVKGAVVFLDLFGEQKLRIGLTINEPGEKESKVLQEGLGLDYNQFIDAHSWLVATDPRDMMVCFIVQQILYADGSSAQFK